MCPSCRADRPRSWFRLPMESVLSGTPVARGSFLCTTSADMVPAWTGTALSWHRRQAHTAALNHTMHLGAHLEELTASEVDPADNRLQRCQIIRECYTFLLNCIYNTLETFVCTQFTCNSLKYTVSMVYCSTKLKFDKITGVWAWYICFRFLFIRNVRVYI